MFELFKDAFPALQSDAAAYSDGVRIWMRIMGLSFLSGIIFIGISRRSLWIVAMALLTMLSLVFGKVFFPEISRSTFGAVTHIVLWPVTLYLLWRPGAVVNRAGSILAIPGRALA